MFSTRQTCRLCNGQLKYVISLGDLYISGFINEDAKDLSKAPLDLMECEDCHLFQLRHTVCSNILYDEYWYQSGLNASMVKALSDVVDSVYSRISLKDTDVVVDIGANDGTLLKNYPSSVYKVAIEPNKLSKLAEAHADLVINDFFSRTGYEQYNLSKAKVITAIAMFYDLEDPHKFVEDLKSILHEDGIIVIQMMDLLSMLQLCDFPNICLGKDELVTTANGLKKISEIEMGDLVLTHKGRFKPVTRVFTNSNNDKCLIKLKAHGNEFDVKLTKNHPVWTKHGEDWIFIRAEDIRIGDIVGTPILISNDDSIQIDMEYYLKNGFQCSSIKEIETVDYFDDYVYNLEVEEDHTYTTPAMVVSNCHEHLEYYSLQVFINLMQQHGLSVFDVEYNGVNGGSMRAYICHTGAREVKSAVCVKLLEEEKYFNEIGSVGEYFRNKIESVRTKIQKYIHSVLSVGSDIAVLGASTKGNTILQYFNLTDKELTHASEINPDKFGKRTIGTNIPIVDQKESLERNPSHYLCLPWGFASFFKEKFHDYMGRGGIIIFPLPQPYICFMDENGVVLEKLL